jgi:hypothetical protein
VLKVNAVDLKGFKLVLQNGKEIYTLATLDSVVPTDAKNGLKLHLVAGSKWAGDMVADLPDGRVLMLKGSLYSRTSASVTPDGKVGAIG